MDPVKKCNIIWGVCFAIMTCIAILFAVLFMLKIKVAGMEQVCGTLSQTLCKGEGGKALDCAWQEDRCVYANT